MPKALGLVETKGLVGAIVAADAMLKAANVTLIGKEKVTAALITIKIIGETAAVKSAIEAGSVAASRVGELVSTHLIPNPDQQIGILFPELLLEAKSESVQLKKLKVKIEKEVIPAAAKVEEPLQKIITEEIPVESKVVEVPVEQVLIEEKKNLKNNPVKKISKVDKESKIENNASLFDFHADPGSSNTGNTLERLKAEALKDLQKEGVTPVEEQPKEIHVLSDKISVEGESVKISFEELEKLNVHQLRKLARGVETFPIHGREISRANREVLLAHFRTIKK